MKHFHLIGIGGTGLSAIARVLLEKGHTVSGSDQFASPLFKSVTAAGAQTFLGHAAEHIAGADLVICSSAIADDNLEVVAAKAQGIPVLKRSEFLKELTRGKETLAIAGSHGKTTTTAILIWILDQLGTDPSFIAGGVVNQLGCNARAGTGPYFAIEADEYDYMFLGLTPKIAVVTNIEHDHPDCFPTELDYQEAFTAFLRRVQPDGLALMCFDHPATRALAEELSSELSIRGYGTSPDAVYRATDITFVEGFPQFKLWFEEQNLGLVKLRIPGTLNVLNATAALAVVNQLGLDLTSAIDAVAAFTGAGRRFEVLGETKGITVIDDYGHHPTELAATLDAARSRYPNRRIWAAWQPHTYSRTRSLENDFTQALDTADKVVVLKIYAAREENPGYSAEVIAEALPSGKAVYKPDFDSASAYLLQELQPRDVLIVFSAGDATQLSQDIMLGLSQTEAKEMSGHE